MKLRIIQSGKVYLALIALILLGQSLKASQSADSSAFWDPTRAQQIEKIDTFRISCPGLPSFLWNSCAAPFGNETVDPLKNPLAFRYGSNKEDLIKEKGKKKVYPPMQFFEGEEVVFTVYAPSEIQPWESLGLVVWISPHQVPLDVMHHDHRFSYAANDRRMIMIVPNRAGNFDSTPWRVTCALAAVELAKRRYNIQSERIYISGGSGGSRVASYVMLRYPEIFTGAMPNCGMNSLSDWKSTNIPVESLSHFYNSTRLAVLEGSGDFNKEQSKAIFDFYEPKMKEAIYLEDPDSGHGVHNTVYLDKALDFLDAPLKSEFRYKADWESIRSHYRVPDWFRDAKFGIFLHWGPYAVPAKGGEKYPKYMYYEGRERNGFNNFEYHKETYGDQSEFGYKDFVPMFKAEKFNAGEWISLFKNAGARYVVPVAEHHDAFAMYASRHTPWNVAEMGPKKDVMRMLADACRAEGLKFGASSHLANWRGYYSKKDSSWDTSDPENYELYWKPIEKGSLPSREFLDQWWNRTTDIIDQYQPDLMWFDFVLDRPGYESLHKPIMAHYYNKGLEWGKEVVFQDKNMKYKSFPEDLIVLDIERGRMDKIFKYPWQTDTSVGKKSWGYITDEEYKSSAYLLDELIDIVSKNGCLLLNIGPRADGTIPDEAKKILEEMGAWLNLNGEAIYATRPWIVSGEGPTKVSAGHHSEAENKENVAADIRFTIKGDSLYATALGWPEDGIFNIQSLAKGNPYESRLISGIEFISGANKIKWKQNSEALKIRTRGDKPCDAAYSFRITF